jgi:hypothetical protein
MLEFLHFDQSSVSYVHMHPFQSVELKQEVNPSILLMWQALLARGIIVRVSNAQGNLASYV